WEIKVDPSNKLRIHGLFVDSVFFLVWLDREHAGASGVRRPGRALQDEPQILPPPMIISPLAQ
ncbi:hypothetical protein ACIKTA_07040, partial [Hansschlegelia beijingensis]